MKPTKYPTLSLDTDGDNYVSIKEYLALVESRGKGEKQGGNFAFYNQRDLGIMFLLILIEKQKGPIHKIACIPPFSMCVYKKNNGKLYSESSDGIVCPSVGVDGGTYLGGGSTNQYSSIIMINSPVSNSISLREPTLFIPNNFKTLINKCKTDNKEMVMCDLTLLMSDNFLDTSHANVLVFDLKRRIIERFDPHGGSIYNDKYDDNNIMGRGDFKFGNPTKTSRALFNQDLIDDIIEDEFKKILPEFRYSGTNETCPYLGPQIKTDAYGGLCVTWSAMYMLLRLLNPKLEPKEITKKMIIGKPNELLNKILRFQRFMIDTIRNYKSRKNLKPL